jgi:superfamily II DNA/RNA helicase
MSPYNTYSSRRAPGGNRQHFGGSSSRPKRSGPHGQYIDPKRFVKAATLSEQDAFISVHQFADFAVAPLIKQNLIGKNYVTPTPIQDQAIPLGLEGKDIIGLANTGTGKTAAFAIPALHRLMLEAHSRALIIAPTRELAQQIEQECRWIAKGSGLTGAVLIGGAAMGPQLRDLRGDPQIVIGTPGRIKDHIDRGTLNLKTFNIVVLDEVDRMLDMGFVHDVRTILSDVNPDRQSFFFSATLDAKVRTLIETFAHDPVTISVKSGDTVDSVHQDVISFGGTTEKLDKLHDLLIDPKVEKVIVFDETQRSVERLSKELEARGFKADAIHGGKTQGQRQRALDQFKQNRINILVATDVAARGIDVSGITHVVNYTVPHSYEDYVHRIGRAGRAGQIGYALTFVPR